MCLSIVSQDFLRFVCEPKKLWRFESRILNFAAWLLSLTAPYTCVFAVPKQFSRLWKIKFCKIVWSYNVNKCKYSWICSVRRLDRCPLFLRVAVLATRNGVIVKSPMKAWGFAHKMKSDGWVWTDVKNCNRKQKIWVLCREVANWKKISKISRWVHWIPSYSTYLNNYLQIAHAEDLEASQSGILSFIISASQRTKKFGLTESHTM